MALSWHRTMRGQSLPTSYKVGDNMIQTELKKHLHYNPVTGNFTRLINNKKSGTLHKNGYIKIRINRRSYLAHRLAWLYVKGVMPSDQIDHINRVRHDNRFSNLREATNQENQRNRMLSKNSTSKVNGVGFHKRSQKWRAYIKVNGKHIHLGLHEDIHMATRAREEAEEIYY